MAIAWDHAVLYGAVVCIHVFLCPHCRHARTILSDIFIALWHMLVELSLELPDQGP